jgi:hypothetical protein
MKKLIVYLSTLLATSLFAASLAGASSFLVSGSNNPGAYIATSSAYFGEMHQPVAVTTPASPWVDSAGPWMTFNNNDQIWPNRPNSGNLPGTYWYLTTFDLGGLNPLSAVLKGSWASDNGGQMFLNDFVPVSTNHGFDSLTYFDITSGFQQGINTLIFMVQNDPWGNDPFVNPTALLVNITESSANPVPEPGTMMLLGAGFLGLAIYGKRRKNA